MKRVALITGGSRGIGYGIAKQLAANGFDLAINGMRDEASVQDVLKNLSDLGAVAVYCQGDISASQDRKKIFQKAKDHFGRLHVLVNNAGVAPRERRDILESTEESFDRVTSTNLKGAYFMTQQAANWMIEQNKSTTEFA